MVQPALGFQFGPFAERFETLETLYLDPAYSWLRAKDHSTGDEIRLQLMHLPEAKAKNALALQWEALKTCRDSLWVRPQEWLERDQYGVLISWVPPGRFFCEVKQTLPDETYLKWMKEALEDLVQLHRSGLLHLAQNEKTWILFKSDDIEGEETIGLSEVPLLAEVPLGQRVNPATVAAVPPELLRGQPLDPRADLYSLAVLFLRQRSAHLFEKVKTVKDNLELHLSGRLAAMVPESETTLNDLLRKMLQADPKDRPGNAQAALALLEPPGESQVLPSRTFPDWSVQRARARQDTLILNILLTLIDGGEAEITRQILDPLVDFLKKDHEPHLLYLQARLARLQGEREAAEEFRRRATVQCYAHSDPKLKSLLLLEEAQVQWEEGKLKEAVVSLEEAWEAIVSVPEPNLQVRVLYERARMRKKLGENLEALEELKQAFDRIPEREPHPAKALVYAELAELLGAHGLARQARPLMDQALTYWEVDPWEAGRRYLQAALVALAGRDGERAREYFKAARDQFSALKDLNALTWAGAHSVRLPLGMGDFDQARRELKAWVSRNRRFHYHTDLLTLVELELWLESGRGLKGDPEKLLDAVRQRAPDWLGRGCFCDLGWPPAKTSRLLERFYQKIKRFPEAMRFASQAERWEKAVSDKLKSLGYPQESLHPGKPDLVSVTTVRVQSLLKAVPEEGFKHAEELKTLQAHAHYLENQIQHLEGVKEGLLRDNLKLNREIESLKEQLTLTVSRGRSTQEKAPPKTETSGSPPAVPPVIPQEGEIKEKKTGPAPLKKRQSGPAPEPDERERILATLQKFQGNRSKAAKDLGMHRRTLHQKIKKYDLEGMQFLPGKEEIEAALAEFKGNRSHAAKKLGMSRSSFYRRLKDLGIE